MPIYNTFELKVRSIFGGIPFPKNAENYGKERTIKKDEPGMTVSMGSIDYFIPSGASWTAGTGKIGIDKAWRIFSESEDCFTIREVTRENELVNPAIGLLSKIEQTLETREP